MSAWRVHTRHIDFVVAAILASDGLITDLPRDENGRVSPTQIGRILLEENFASVDSRYREREERPVYAYRRLELPDLSTREGLSYAVNAVASYGYQSCEHEAWEQSQARAWSEAVERSLSAALEARGGREPSNINGWTVGPNYSPEHAMTGERADY